MYYEQEADRVVDAICKMAENEDALLNFGSYLTYHFPEWLRRFARTPEGIVEELEYFAGLYDTQEAAISK